MIDNLAKPGGQLLGLYFLTLVACALSFLDHPTGVNLLNMLIGAILRDMQDTRAKPL